MIAREVKSQQKWAHLGRSCLCAYEVASSDAELWSFTVTIRQLVSPREDVIRLPAMFEHT